VEVEPPYAVPLDRTYDGTLGFELIEASNEAARARIPVEDRVRQPYGLVHGGAICGIAEGLCSAATDQGVRDGGMVAMGMANHTSFIRPIFSGHVNAEARCRHRGRTTWVWEVDITDDDGRLAAVSRVTVAVRPRPS
jgi:1,4-dihydroxy-2-naphthoyl-CoA hydrolase